MIPNYNDKTLIGQMIKTKRMNITLENEQNQPQKLQSDIRKKDYLAKKNRMYYAKNNRF